MPGATEIDAFAFRHGESLSSLKYMLPTNFIVAVCTAVTVWAEIRLIGSDVLALKLVGFLILGVHVVVGVQVLRVVYRVWSDVVRALAGKPATIFNSEKAMFALEYMVANAPLKLRLRHLLWVIVPWAPLVILGAHEAFLLNLDSIVRGLQRPDLTQRLLVVFNSPLGSNSEAEQPGAKWMVELVERLLSKPPITLKHV